MAAKGRRVEEKHNGEEHKTKTAHQRGSNEMPSGKGAIMKDDLHDTLSSKLRINEESEGEISVSRSPTPIPTVVPSSAKTGTATATEKNVDPLQPSITPTLLGSGGILGEDSLCIEDTQDFSRLSMGLRNAEWGGSTEADRLQGSTSFPSPSPLESQVAPSVTSTQEGGSAGMSASSNNSNTSAIQRYGLRGPPPLLPRQRPRFHTVQDLDSALHQAIEGKINARNAWESKEANDLLEGIAQTVEQTLEAHPQDDYGGFAKVATVVEGCSKVWTSRVDSTYKRSNQMVQRLLRNDDDVDENGKKKGRGGGGWEENDDGDSGENGTGEGGGRKGARRGGQNGEGDEEEDVDEDDPIAVARQRQKKSRKGLRPIVSRTLVLDPSEINLDSKGRTALLQSGINAQFRAMTEKFDQSHAWGLLMHNAPLGRAGNWILDVDYSRETSGGKKSYSARAARQKQQLEEYKKMKKRVRGRNNSSNDDDDESPSHPSEEGEEEEGEEGGSHGGYSFSFGTGEQSGRGQSERLDPLGAMARSMGFTLRSRLSRTSVPSSTSTSCRTSSSSFSTAACLSARSQKEDESGIHHAMTSSTPEGGQTTETGREREEEEGRGSKTMNATSSGAGNASSSEEENLSPNVLKEGSTDAPSGDVQKEGKEVGEAVPTEASGVARMEEEEELDKLFSHTPTDLPHDWSPSLLRKLGLVRVQRKEGGKGGNTPLKTEENYMDRGDGLPLEEDRRKYENGGARLSKTEMEEEEEERGRDSGNRRENERWSRVIIPFSPSLLLLHPVTMTLEEGDPSHKEEEVEEVDSDQRISRTSVVGGVGGRGGEARFSLHSSPTTSTRTSLKEEKTRTDLSAITASRGSAHLDHEGEGNADTDEFGWDSGDGGDGNLGDDDDSYRDFNGSDGGIGVPLSELSEQQQPPPHDEEEEKKRQQEIAAAARRLIDGTDALDAYDRYASNALDTDGDGWTEMVEERREEEDGNKGVRRRGENGESDYDNDLDEGEYHEYSDTDDEESRRVSRRAGDGSGDHGLGSGLEAEDPSNFWCMLQELPTSSLKTAPPRSELQQLHKAAKSGQSREGMAGTGVGGGRGSCDDGGTPTPSPFPSLPGATLPSPTSSSSPAAGAVSSGKKTTSKKGKTVTFDLPSIASQLESVMPSSPAATFSVRSETSVGSPTDWIHSLVHSPRTPQEGGTERKGGDVGGGVKSSFGSTSLQPSPTIRKNLTPLGKALLLDKNAAANVLAFTQTAFQRQKAEEAKLLLPPPWHHGPGEGIIGAGGGDGSPASPSSQWCLPSFLPIPPLRVHVFFQPFSTHHTSWNVLKKSVSSSAAASARMKDSLRQHERRRGKLGGGGDDDNDNLGSRVSSPGANEMDGGPGQHSRFSMLNEEEGREDILPIERIPGGVPVSALPSVGRGVGGNHSGASSSSLFGGEEEDGEDPSRRSSQMMMLPRVSCDIDSNYGGYDNDLLMDDNGGGGEEDDDDNGGRGDGRGSYLDDEEEEMKRRETELRLLEQLQANALRASADGGGGVGGWRAPRGQFSLSSLRGSGGGEEQEEEGEGDGRDSGTESLPPGDTLSPEEWLKALQAGPGPLGFLQAGVDVSQLRQVMWEAIQEVLSTGPGKLSASVSHTEVQRSGEGKKENWSSGGQRDGPGSHLPPQNSVLTPGGPVGGGNGAVVAGDNDFASAPMELNSKARRVFRLSGGANDLNCHTGSSSTTGTTTSTQNEAAPREETTEAPTENLKRRKRGRDGHVVGDKLENTEEEEEEKEEDDESVDRAFRPLDSSSLSEVVARLMPYANKISPTGALSPAFLFFSLLFIANEHNVILENAGTSKFGDVKILGIASPPSDLRTEDINEQPRKKQKRKNPV